MEKLTQAKAQENNTLMETELWNIGMREQQCRISRRIKHMLKQNKDVGTTRIQTYQNQELTNITDEEEMERLIIAKNKKSTTRLRINALSCMDNS